MDKGYESKLKRPKRIPPATQASAKQPVAKPEKRQSVFQDSTYTTLISKPHETKLSGLKRPSLRPDSEVTHLAKIVLPQASDSSKIKRESKIGGGLKKPSGASGTGVVFKQMKPKQTVTSPQRVMTSPNHDSVEKLVINLSNKKADRSPSSPFKPSSGLKETESSPPKEEGDKQKISPFKFKSKLYKSRADDKSRTFQTIQPILAERASLRIEPKPRPAAEKVPLPADTEAEKSDQMAFDDEGLLESPQQNLPKPESRPLLSYKENRNKLKQFKSVASSQRNIGESRLKSKTFFKNAYRASIQEEDLKELARLREKQDSVMSRSRSRQTALRSRLFNKGKAEEVQNKLCELSQSQVISSILGMGSISRANLPQSQQNSPQKQERKLEATQSEVIQSPFVPVQSAAVDITEQRKDLKAELSDMSIERIVDANDPDEVFGGQNEEDIDDAEIIQEMKFDSKNEKAVTNGMEELGPERSDLDEDEVIIRVDQPKPKRPTSLARDLRDSKDFVASLQTSKLKSLLSMNHIGSASQRKKSVTDSHGQPRGLRSVDRANSMCSEPGQQGSALANKATGLNTIREARVRQPKPEKKDRSPIKASTNPFSFGKNKRPTTAIAQAQPVNSHQKTFKPKKILETKASEQKRQKGALSKRSSIAQQPTLEKVTSSSKQLKKSELLRLQRLQEMKENPLKTAAAAQSKAAPKKKKVIIVKQMNGITLKRKVHANRTTASEGEHKDEFVRVQISLDENGLAMEETVLDSRLECQYCGRLFDPESHGKHQNKCNNVYMSRRPQFVSAHYRLVEEAKQVEQTVDAQVLFSGGNRRLNDNWRIQQQTFRAAIAAAKRGQVFSDGTIDDRVLCKNCGRKFRADVAERHIPRCTKKK